MKLLSSSCRRRAARKVSAADLLEPRVLLSSTTAILSVTPDTGASASDQVTSAASLSVSGTAAPSLTVQISEATLGPLGTTTADEFGDWSIDLGSALGADEVYSLQAVALDGGVPVGDASAPFTVTIDQTPPSAPLLNPVERVDVQHGVFHFRISGTAEPQSQVTIRQADGVVVGNVDADEAGNWEVTLLDAELADGRFSFTATATDLAGNPSTPSTAQEYRPNIVLINADDIRADMLQYLPNVLSLLSESGTTFLNSFVPTSLSGPSRASLLTGQYAHNNGVLSNADPLGGAINFDDSSTLPIWLQEVGYRTALIGKDRTQAAADSTFPSVPANPTGWDEFYIATAYYGGRVNDNGTLIPRTTTAEDYATDMLADRAADFVDSNAGAHPFFLYFAPYAPHAPYVPAQRHLDAFQDLEPWTPPSYNVPDAGRPALSSDELAYTQTQRRLQLAASLAIDDAVGQLISALQQSQQLDNTVIVFTGDNGYFWGEHAKYTGKGSGYDESIRVPLVIRDGRAPNQQTANEFALNIDLAPTILDYAGASTNLPMDGTSLRSVVAGESIPWRSDFLVAHHVVPSPYSQVDEEAVGETNATTPHVEYGVLADGWFYNEWSTGERFLFEMQTDPYQLINLAADSAYADQLALMAARLAELKPADQLGPAIQSLVATPTSPGVGLPFLRLSGSVSDIGFGNSSVRSPEYFFNQVGFGGSGRSLDTLDGRFDSPFEGFTRDLTLSQLRELPAGQQTIFVHGRDIAGNWGGFVSVPFILGAAPSLDSDSDTGFVGDGRTIDQTPTYSGVAEPFDSVKLFAINDRTSETVLIGEAVADASGQWTITSSTLALGTYDVMAVIESDVDSEIRFTAAHRTVIAAAIDANGVLTVVGTNDDDTIVVDATNPLQTTVTFEGVLVGEFTSPTRIIVQGGNGNDVLRVLGAINAELFGENGDDTLEGGSGDDRLDGGNGSDVLIGGPGDDVYLFRDFSATSTGILNEVFPTANGFFNGYVDQIHELPQEGHDILDLSAVRNSIRVNLASLNTVIASYSHELLPRFIKQIITVTDPSLARHLEEVRSGRANDELTGNSRQILRAAAGDDQLNFVDTSAPTAPIALQGLSIGNIANVNASVVVRIESTNAPLTIRTDVPGGLTAGQVTGNGTTSLRLAATVGLINTTLGAELGLLLGPTLSDDILFRVFNANGITLRETDVITYRVNNRPLVRLNGTAYIVKAGYREGDPSLRFAPQAFFQDLDDNLDGGVLIVEHGGYSEAADQVGIVSQGTAPGQISVTGTEIRYGGVLIGTVTSSGENGGTLRVVFNSAATSAAVQALLRQLSFLNTSNNPGDAPRELKITVIDDLGVAAVSRTATINVTSVNEKPVVRLNGTAYIVKANYTEGDPPLRFAPNAFFLDGDDNLDGGTLVVAPSGNVDPADQLVIATQGNDAGQIGVVGEEIRFGGVLLGTITSSGEAGGTLRVTFNRFATSAAVQALLRQLTFSNPSTNPSEAVRDYQITVTDDRGAASVSRTATIDFKAVHFRPVVRLNGTAYIVKAIYTEGNPPLQFAPNATFEDLDDNLGGGTLVVAPVGYSEAADHVAIASQGDNPGEIRVDGSAIYFGGVRIGTATSFGQSGGTLRVTFNAAATSAAVQALLRRLTYFNSSYNPGAANRQLNVTVTDSSGLTSVTRTATIEIRTVNFKPLVRLNGTAYIVKADYTFGGPPLRFAPNAFFEDLDENLNGGSLIVAPGASSDADDHVLITSQGDGAGQIGIDANSIRFGGIVIGTIVGSGASGGTLRVIFNSFATNAGVQALLQQLTYSNTSSNPTAASRVLNITVTDDLGVAAVTRAATITLHVPD